MAEPLGDKGIRDVPGIGDVLGAKLSEAGYDKVRSLFRRNRFRKTFSFSSSLGLYVVRQIFAMSKRC